MSGKLEAQLQMQIPLHIFVHCVFIRHESSDILQVKKLPAFVCLVRQHSRTFSGESTQIGWDLQTLIIFRPYFPEFQ